MNAQEAKKVQEYSETSTFACVGRFQISIPQQMTVVSSNVIVNAADISVKPMSRQMYERFVDNRLRELKSTSSTDKRNNPYLKKVIDNTKESIIFDRNQSKGTPDALRTLEAYKFDNNLMFSLELDMKDVSKERYRDIEGPEASNINDRLIQVRYLLDNLHPHVAGELPSEPGVCFGDGFLAGGFDESVPGASIPFRDESMTVAFLDQDNQDVYLHFNIDANLFEKDTLLDRTSMAINLLNDDENFSVLRKGKVMLEGIDQAEEILSTSTTPDKVRGHEFFLEANSMLKSKRKPFVKIKLISGSTRKAIDSLKIDQASLSDAEAVGLWDAIIPTFQPRSGAF